MPREALEGVWVRLDTIDSGVSSPSPPTYNTSGAEAAALEQHGRDSIADIRSKADDWRERDDVMELVRMYGVQLKIVREATSGHLWAFLTPGDVIKVLLVGWRLTKDDLFAIDSQLRSLSDLLSKPTKAFGVAEKDFAKCVWTSPHEAWIRLVLNAVRVAWPDVEVVEDFDMESMV